MGRAQYILIYNNQFLENKLYFVSSLFLSYSTVSFLFNLNHSSIVRALVLRLWFVMELGSNDLGNSLFLYYLLIFNSSYSSFQNF